MTSRHHRPEGLPAVAAALLLCATFAAPLAAFAQSEGDAPPDGAPRGHAPGASHGPPPEAIAACKGKALGVVASFTDRGGRAVSGPCTQVGDVVAVPPPRHAPGDRDGPPQPAH